MSVVEVCFQVIVIHKAPTDRLNRESIRLRFYDLARLGNRPLPSVSYLLNPDNGAVPIGGQADGETADDTRESRRPQSLSQSLAQSMRNVAKQFSELNADHGDVLTQRDAPFLRDAGDQREIEVLKQSQSIKMVS
jgi:hypothetical protein